MSFHTKLPSELVNSGSPSKAPGHQHLPGKQQWVECKSSECSTAQSSHIPNSPAYVSPQITTDTDPLATSLRVCFPWIPGLSPGGTCFPVHPAGGILVLLPSALWVGLADCLGALCSAHPGKYIFQTVYLCDLLIFSISILLLFIQFFVNLLKT